MLAEAGKPTIRQISFSLSTKSPTTNIMKRLALLFQLCLICVVAETTQMASDEVQAVPALNGNIIEITALLDAEKMNRDSFGIVFTDGMPTEFVGGTYLFINASQTTVAGQIGDEKFELKPSQQKLLSPTATHKNGGCQVTFSYQKEEKWKVFKDTRWSTNKGYRSLIFFHQHPVSGQLMISPVVDLLPYKPPATD